MTFNVNTVVGILGFVFLILGILGTAIATFKSNSAMALIRIQEANNNELERKIDLLVKENELHKADIKTKAAQLAEQSARIKYLEDIVSGASAIEKLSHKIDTHYKAILEALNGRS